MNPAERDVKILSGTWTRNVFQTLNQSKTSLNHSVWSKYIRFFKYFQVKKYFQLQSNIPVLRLVRRIRKCTSVICCDIVLGFPQRILGELTGKLFVWTSNPAIRIGRVWKFHIASKFENLQHSEFSYSSYPYPRIRSSNKRFAGLLFSCDFYPQKS